MMMIRGLRHCGVRRGCYYGDPHRPRPLHGRVHHGMMSLDRRTSSTTGSRGIIRTSGSRRRRIIITSGTTGIIIANDAIGSSALAVSYHQHRHLLLRRSLISSTTAASPPSSTAGSSSSSSSGVAMDNNSNTNKSSNGTPVSKIEEATTRQIPLLPFQTDAMDDVIATTSPSTGSSTTADSIATGTTVADSATAVTTPTATTPTATTPTATTTNSNNNMIHQNILKLLTNEGAFSATEYTLARDFFYSFTTTNTASSSMEQFQPEDRISLGLRLYERLLQEIQYQGNITELQQQQKKWICDLYQTIIPLLKEWKRNYVTASVVGVNPKAKKATKRTRTRRLSRGNNTTPFSVVSVPASVILQTLQRCEGRYLLQSPPPPPPPPHLQQLNHHNFHVFNRNIHESYYFWCNPVLVPLLLDMLLRQKSNATTPMDAEKFLRYVQKRQLQLQPVVEHSHEPEEPHNDVVSRPTTADHHHDLQQPFPSESIAIDVQSATTASTTAATVTASDRVPQIQYQFPNEAMCQQLLHAWVRWGCRGIGDDSDDDLTDHYEKNRVAIRQVETLISKMVNLYNITPSIQCYNGLLKLHAQSSPTLATMKPWIQTPMNADQPHFNDRPAKKSQQKQRRVGSVFGREHRTKIDAILRTIHQLSEKVQPTLETWYQAVLCYCNWNCFFDAQDVVFKKMIPMIKVTTPSSVADTIKDNDRADDNRNNANNVPRTTSNISTLGTNGLDRQSAIAPLLDLACHRIVMGYRRLIGWSTKKSSRIITNDQKRDLLQQLTTFMESLQQLPPNTISHRGLEQIYGTLMDVYAREGNITQLDSLIEKMDSPNLIFYCLLIKAYGIDRRPDRGEELLRDMLFNENSRVRPTIEAFNALINAWAINPTIPDAPNRALAIIRFMDHNVSCIQLGIQPDTRSFNMCLKCLSAASAPRLQAASSNVSSSNESSVTPQGRPITDNMGQYVHNILMEMEGRFRAGNRSVLPDEITYNSAIQCCANVGDKGGALSLLKRMKNSRISPSIRTYNTILAMYAQIGTSDSAHAAEEQVMILRQLARRNPSVKPDVFSFNHLYQAWTKSGDTQLYDRIWMIYKRMRSEDFDVKPDMVMYTCLISTLSRSPNMQHLDYATALLDDMEQNHCFDALLRPDSRHYMPIINAHLNRIKINNDTHDLSISDGESSCCNIEMAAKIFLRFMQSYVRGRTGYDAPKQETIHAIVKGFIQTQKTSDGKTFLARIESYNAFDTSLQTKKNRYYKTPIQATRECYLELENASLAVNE